ncbi:MAG TPA: hypothetical protein VGJ91_12085 [Polyangiaceae bacterium]
MRTAVGRRASPKLRWRIAEWPAHPNQLLALSFESAGFGADNRSLEPRLALLERRSGALARVAEGRIDLREPRCANDSGGPDDERAPDFRLDLGLYGISKSSAALGVRFSCFHSATTEDGSAEFLYLLEPVDTQLRQVLEARLAFTHYVRPTFTETTGVGTLSIVQEQSKNGYFDLVLRMAVTVQTSDPQLHPDAPASGKHEETQRFSWNGSLYRPQTSSHH